MCGQRWTQFEQQNSPRRAFSRNGKIYTAVWQLCKIFFLVRITTIKQQNFSQSNTVLICQFLKKFQSDPVLIRPSLALVLIQSWSVLIFGSQQSRLRRSLHVRPRRTRSRSPYFKFEPEQEPEPEAILTSVQASIKNFIRN